MVREHGVYCIYLTEVQKSRYHSAVIELLKAKKGPNGSPDRGLDIGHVMIDDPYACTAYDTASELYELTLHECSQHAKHENQAWYRAHNRSHINYCSCEAAWFKLSHLVSSHRCPSTKTDSMAILLPIATERKPTLIKNHQKRFTRGIFVSQP